MSRSRLRLPLQWLRKQWHNARHYGSSAAAKGDLGYFKQANSWYDELYTATLSSRNRYRLMSMLMSIMILMLLLLICCLVPNQRVVPLMVNHYQDGRVDVVPLKSVKVSAGMINSDLVRYVVNRESFDKHAYASQYRLVALLSSPQVMRAFQHQQSQHSKASPVSLMRHGIYRTVFVDSVVLLDAKKHLAQVNYVMTDHDPKHDKAHSQAMTALIRWHYGNVSPHSLYRWQNWNGFEVDYYQREQRHAPQYH